MTSDQDHKLMRAAGAVMGREKCPACCQHIDLVSHPMYGGRQYGEHWIAGIRCPWSGAATVSWAKQVMAEAVANRMLKGPVWTERDPSQGVS